MSNFVVISCVHFFQKKTCILLDSHNVCWHSGWDLKERRYWEESQPWMERRLWECCLLDRYQVTHWHTFDYVLPHWRPALSLSSFLSVTHNLCLNTPASPSSCGNWIQCRPEQMRRSHRWLLTGLIMHFRFLLTGNWKLYTIGHQRIKERGFSQSQPDGLWTLLQPRWSEERFTVTKTPKWFTHLAFQMPTITALRHNDQGLVVSCNEVDLAKFKSVVQVWCLNGAFPWLRQNFFLIHFLYCDHQIYQIVAWALS